MHFLYMDLDVGDFSAYNEILGRSCREVLSSGLNDKVYAGDMADLVNFDSIDATLKQMYEKIARLAHCVITIKKARNSLCSVSRLPEEILSRIFGLCTPPNGHTVPQASLLYAFSQVCTTWRRVALADPSLWTSLDVSKSDLSKLFMARSQSMPLFISNSSQSHFSPLDLLSERNRVCAFRLYFWKRSESTADEQVNACLSGHFPLLNTLSLSNMGRIGTYTCDLKMPEVPLLRNLTLRNWVLRDWNVPILHNLTSIALVYSPGHQTAMFTISGVLRILRACPELVSLTLCGLIPANTIHPPHNDRTTLLRLKIVSLNESLGVTYRLLSRLHLPSVREIVMDLDFSAYRSSPVPYAERLPPVIHNALRTARWTPLRDVHFRFGSGLKVLARASHSEPTHTERTIRLSQFNLLDEGDGATAFQKSLISALIQDTTTVKVEFVVPRFHVKGPIFFYSINSAVMPVFWASLATQPALQVLKLDANLRISFVGLLFALNPTLAVDPFQDDISRPNDPFPALRSLDLSGLQMVQILHGKSALAHLLAFLDRRKQQQRPVDVVFRDCDMIETEVQSLLTRDDIIICST